MLQRLSWSLTDYMIHRNIFPEEDGEIYAFGFECMLSTLTTFSILSVIGLVTGLFPELFFFLLGFVGIKKHIGGYHANTHLACISISCGMSVGSAIICRWFPLWTTVPFLLTALVLIFLLAPVPHPNNPKTEEELVESRRLSLRNASMVALGAAALTLTPWSFCAVYLSFGLVMAALQLLIKSPITEQE